MEYHKVDDLLSNVFQLAIETRNKANDMVNEIQRIKAEILAAEIKRLEASEA